MDDLSTVDLHKQLPSIAFALLTVILSKPTSTAPYRKVCIRRGTEKQGKTRFFAEFFMQKQAFQRTLDVTALEKLLIDEVGILYKHSIIETQSEQITILSNKKGKITILKKPTSANFQKTDDNFSGTEKECSTNQCLANQCDMLQNVPNSHNRQKKHLLTEGKPIPFLVHLGVMNADGKVIAQKYDKFRQINRFLEFIEDILHVPVDRPIRVLDFGCGKSYLTFALYYYLTEIRHLKADITGLDIKKDVIENCSKLAQKWAYEGLHFELGRIEEYRETDENGDFGSFDGKKTLDMVIMLHACDTATDYALAYAVKRSAKVILSVPCCQHELNATLGKHCPNSAFDSLMKYGIVKERFAALATDVMRSELLEKAGYSVQLMEFIDIAHTPKNLLIRAVLRDSPQKNSAVAQKNSNITSKNSAIAQKSSVTYDALCEAMGVRTKLDDLLND